VGKAALAGQPGIISIHNGWLGGKEVNRVVYDSDLTSIEQMESLLKGAGTYIKTVQELPRGNKKSEKPE
jgi:hypothetical protein